MPSLFHEKSRENIIVVAHRGVAGGNIPCNTLASYEIALKQSADMIEVDVSRSLDGELFIFHPSMELAHLNKAIILPTLPYSVIKKLNYVNCDNTKTQFSISSLDDVFEQFKGRCFINIDKFWSNPEEIYSAIKRHNMTEQVLVKSKINKKVLRVLEELCPQLPFMPIVHDTHPTHNELMSRKINYVGVECVFKNDNAPVAQDGFIEKLHNDNKLVWFNSIIYNHKDQLAGGHSDDTALTISEDYGWGWIADKKVDFIQTDWPMMLIDYLKRTEKYYKNREKVK
jgi:glycerophosphoryl diester phosphodiesterase